MEETLLNATVRNLLRDNRNLIIALIVSSCLLMWFIHSELKSVKSTVAGNNSPINDYSYVEVKGKDAHVIKVR